MPQLKGYND